MAEARTISQFKSKLAGGAARPNLFEVSIPSFPSSVSDAWNSGDNGENGTFKFLCKAANLPASTVAAINVPFRGRNLKVAGDKTFADWTVTVINDEDFKLRTAFEKWSNALSRLEDNTGVTNPASYMTDAYVQQLGRVKRSSPPQIQVVNILSWERTSSMTSGQITSVKLHWVMIQPTQLKSSP